MPTPTFFNLPDEKRQRIIDFAIDEFAQHDYDSASITQIVANAGIAKGSLYQYFADKSDLHRYLLELASQKKAEMLAATRSTGPGLPLFDTLRWLFQEMANFEILYPRLAKIGYRAIYGKSSLPEDIVNQARQSTTQFFIDLIDQGKQRNEIRSDIDSGVAAFIFSAALSQLGIFLTTQAKINPKEIVEGGSYPLKAPEVIATYNQIISILQYGIAERDI